MAENLEQLCAVYCYQTSAAKIRVVHTKDIENKACQEEGGSVYQLAHRTLGKWNPDPLPYLKGLSHEMDFNNVEEN